MDKPALREITLGRMLDEAIMQHPDNEAVIYVDRNFRMTYREFGELVDNLAKGLMAMGVQKGEKVAIWAPTCRTGWPFSSPRPRSGRCC